ncbi:MAG TPA: mechanosensitive ion channel domain-containing protein, partial [Desulfobacteria bacterium]|nr:mechanosensitive ion channel domain-containing protein [Desulfobacteria bacterium]
MKRHIIQVMSATLIFLAFFFAMSSGWAEAEIIPSKTPEVSQEVSQSLSQSPAIVMIHNRPIVIFYASLFGHSPDQRMKLCEARIDRILSGKTLGKVTAKEIAAGTVIAIGESDVLLITPEDANPAFGQDKKELVDRAVRNLTLAIDEVKEWRSPRHILMAAGYVFLATILYLAILWGLSRISRWTETRLEKVEKKWVGQVDIKGFSLLEHVTQITHILMRIIAWTVGLFATYSWLVFSLKRFPYTRAWGESLGKYLMGTIETIVVGVVDTLPNIFIVAVIIVCTKIFSRLVKKLFQAVEEGRVRFMAIDPDVAKPTSRIIMAILWLFALIMAYPYLPGSGTDAFKGVTIFAGLIASLGSTSIVNQAAGGLVLMYAKAFRTGDYIKVEENEGVVTSLGILSTKIRTARKEEVTIPNAVLVGNTTINYTRLAGESGVMIHASVSIGYTTPWRKVQSLLLSAAGKTRGLLTQPPPFVRQVGLSDFYVQYQLTAAVSSPGIRSETFSELLGNIQDVFNEHGEQIMSPHYVADTPQKQI